MASDIIKGNEARTGLLEGMAKVADVVGMTMGAKGRNVVLGRGNKSPLVTNDGVTVAKEIVLPNALENV
jgi:chaperonin GroEL